MNIVKFLRTHILENICERPLLKHQKTSGLFLKEVYFCILELSAQFLVVLDIRSTYRQSSYTDLVLIKKKKRHHILPNIFWQMNFDGGTN